MPSDSCGKCAFSEATSRCAGRSKSNTKPGKCARSYTRPIEAIGMPAGVSVSKIFFAGPGSPSMSPAPPM